MYSVAIFDVGDTLLEYMPKTPDLHIERMRSFGIEIPDSRRDDIAACIENAGNAQIEREEKGEPRLNDADFETLLDMAALNAIYGNEKSADEVYALAIGLRQIPLGIQRLSIIPGAMDVLAELSARNYRLAIVSNHRKWLPELLSSLGIGMFFESIIVSEIVGYEKPDTRIMEASLSDLRLEAGDCLYIGDHPYDVYCARKAGMDCAWIAPKDKILPSSIPYQENYRISGLADLLRILPSRPATMDHK
ncbi:HAD family hydrolase [Eubacteriales bacterium OttesenSCG-928-A19]|nr:HAD family hydrolase [Eubacteriales bacterium OttesenSCG-928-A19]